LKTTARNTTGSNHCIILLSSWWWAYWCPKHVEQTIRSAIKTSVASSWHFISTFYTYLVRKWEQTNPKTSVFLKFLYSYVFKFWMYRSCVPGSYQVSVVITSHMCHLASVMLPITFVAYHRIFLSFHLLFIRKSFTCLIPGHFCFHLSHPTPTPAHTPRPKFSREPQKRTRVTSKGCRVFSCNCKL